MKGEKSLMLLRTKFRLSYFEKIKIFFPRFYKAHSLIEKVAEKGCWGGVGGET